MYGTHVTILLFLGVSLSSALPITNESVADPSSGLLSNETGVPQDLYVIKTIVYEVGILTDASNLTNDSSEEPREQVDVSFFDRNRNGSVIDLSNIPFPIQTNVSGVSVTGILPANLGSIVLSPEGKPQLNSTFPLLPNKQVKVTQNISTFDPAKGSQIISNLPNLLGLNSTSLNVSVNSTKSDH